MNPFFGVMGGGRPNMMQQFQQFMNQMKGKDPNAVIQDMMQSGKITQDQYNQARQQAQQGKQRRQSRHKEQLGQRRLVGLPNSGPPHSHRSRQRDGRRRGKQLPPTPPGQPAHQIFCNQPRQKGQRTKDTDNNGHMLLLGCVHVWNEGLHGPPLSRPIWAGGTDTFPYGFSAPP